MYGGIRRRGVGYKPFKTGASASRPSKYTPLYNLRGGINTSVPAHDIEDDQISDGYNVIYTDWGIGTRPGKTKYNSVEISGATSIRGIHASYLPAGRTLLVADDQGVLHSDDGTGTFTAIYSSFTADSKYYFSDWRNLTIVANENEKLFKWDGSNFNEIPDSPSGAAGVTNAEGRLFAWKLTDNNLYFCGLNDEETWDTASEYSGFLVLPQVKGDFPVLALKQGRSVVVFKNNSIWKYHLNGLPRNWTRELISNAIGISGKYAGTSFQDVIFFQGSDGRMYQLSESLKLLSKDIDCPDTTRWGLPSDINTSKKNETVCYYDSSARKVRWIYNDSSATTNYPNIYADYYIVDDAWLRGNLSASCVAVCDGKDDTGYVYSGSPNSGYVYRLDNGTSDDGAAINSYIITKAYHFGITDAKKILEAAYSTSKPVGNWNAELRHYVDFDTVGTGYNVSQTSGGALWDSGTWDSSVWGGGGLARNRTSLGNVAGYYHQFKFGTNTIDKYFNLRGVGFKYKMAKLI